MAAHDIHAHGPFDNSARLILRDDSLQLEVILGKEAAAKFLKDSPPETLRPTGPSEVRPLPADMAMRLGILTANGRALGVQSIAVHVDQLEAGFVATYPRPAAGALAFQSDYFEAVQELKPGMLQFTDENGNGLGAAVLSRNAPLVEFKVPAVAIQPVAPAEPSAVKTEPPIIKNLPYVKTMQAMPSSAPASMADNAEASQPVVTRPNSVVSLSLILLVAVFLILAAMLFYRTKQTVSRN